MSTILGISTSLLFIFIGMAGASATIRTGVAEYTVDGATFEGYWAYNDALSGRRPAVLVVHEWWGLNDYARHRAEQLAALGYVAFAVDMYGKGVRPTTPQEAGKAAGALKADRALMRARINGALAFVKQNPRVDASRVTAIGYCFGGTVALELARSGADVLGVVSFHGGLDTPNPETTKNMKAKILVLRGGDDPNVPPAQVEAFEKEMRAAGADWQEVAYGGAVHSFTNPASGNDPTKGVAYNASADRRSWQAMTGFFQEILK